MSAKEFSKQYLGDWQVVEPPRVRYYFEMYDGNTYYKDITENYSRYEPFGHVQLALKSDFIYKIKNNRKIFEKNRFTSSHSEYISDEDITLLNLKAQPYS